jgi:transketolase
MTTLPILDHIYKTKRPEDLVVLSNGHAGLALYCILEKYEGRNAEELFEKYGVHPYRDTSNGLHVASGSLGSAILVACGLANWKSYEKVHVIISDGECAEGSVWEALRMRLPNMLVHVNVNGYSAYDKVDTRYLWWRLKAFDTRIHVWFTRVSDEAPVDLHGLQGHYHVLKNYTPQTNNEERFRYASAFCYEVKLKAFCDYGRSWLWYFGSYPARLSRAFY